MKDEYKKPLATLLACLIGLAAFIATDRLLFDLKITPEAILPLAGWIVCLGAGIYAASLFWKKNAP